MEEFTMSSSRGRMRKRLERALLTLLTLREIDSSADRDDVRVPDAKAAASIIQAAALLPDDISWMELRVTQVARVFGFRAGQAFFLVFLDRAHEIMPG